jgi:hypothetical protein
MKIEMDPNCTPEEYAEELLTFWLLLTLDFGELPDGLRLVLVTEARDGTVSVAQAGASDDWTGGPAALVALLHRAALWCQPVVSHDGGA